MYEAIKDLKPHLLWSLFSEICSIPHGSGNEAALAAHLSKRGEDAGFAVKRDDVGNICISVPAKAGYEQAPTVVLQGHIDMVCEKNANTMFDFNKDSIRTVKDGEWIKADGTTLGADNGIGVAAALAVALSEDTVHGPLEILLTIDEESGLTGAQGLADDLLTGRILLNLDSEETDILYIGCAGGGGVTASLPVAWVETQEERTSAKLELTGLRGGHSGLSIHENRGNAIKLLARTALALQPLGIAIAEIHAGDKHNAIPREGFMLLTLPQGQFEQVQEIVADQLSQFKGEFPRDPNLDMQITSSDLPAKVFTNTTAGDLIDMLLAYQHGVLAMSQDLPDLVETSTNLASVHLQGDDVVIHNSPRSSVGSALRGVTDQLLSVGRLAEAKNVEEASYPGWQPNPDSPVLKLAQNVHEELFGIKPKPLAIHAGLECGIIGEKFDGMDMLSFGPDIRNPHSPDEAVHIASVEKFWKLLLGVLAKIAEAKD